MAHGPGLTRVWVRWRTVQVGARRNVGAPVSTCVGLDGATPYEVASSTKHVQAVPRATSIWE